MYFVLAYRLRKKKEFLFVQSRRYNHQICSTTYYILINTSYLAHSSAIRYLCLMKCLMFMKILEFKKTRT